MQRSEPDPETAPPPASTPPATSTSHRRKRSRAIKLGLGVATVIAVATPTAAIVAWQNDERSHTGRVASATSVAGINVSGNSEPQLRTTLLALQQRLRSESIDIGHDQQRFTTQTSAFGLDLDIDATQSSVLRFGRDEGAPKRFVRWIGGHFDNRDAPVIVSLDSDKLAGVISNGDPGPRTQPTNPTISFRDGDFVAIKGTDGHGLINSEAPAAIRAAVRQGFPLRAHVASGDIPAISNTQDLDTVIKEARAVTQAPLNVSAEGKQATLTIEQLQQLMSASASGDHLRLDLDATATAKLLQERFPDAGTKPVEAGYNVVDDKPVLVDGKSGTTCCSDVAYSAIRDALASRLSGGDSAAVVALPMKSVNPTTTRADIPDLGIKEKIGTFTTYHPRNQPRVTNIHLISDLTRGAVVKPGEMFSINDTVGKRTAEKGFVVDHVIEDGKFTDSIGGGISQYATTLFNAAFFAGLDFGEYQSHSIYIERYPYGREATVSFPHPDMQVKNTTPYGVLIWPTYTDRSLTVSLYSTKYATGAQTKQTTAPAGKCTRVRTERTRTYVDGHTSIDTVGALYQPKEGERC